MRKTAGKFLSWSPSVCASRGGHCHLSALSERRVATDGRGRYHLLLRAAVASVAARRYAAATAVLRRAAIAGTAAIVVAHTTPDMV